ncbi:MAG: glycosyltransferase family 9 protein [bacterium]
MIITEKIEKNIYLRILVKYSLKIILSLNKYLNNLFTSSTSEEILVISLHKIGDTLFTVPSVKYLHKKFDKNLFVLCFEDNAVLYRTFISKDINLITIKADDFYFSSRIIKPKAIKTIRLMKFKYVFDFNGAINSVSVLFFIKSKWKYGFTDFYLNNAYTNYIYKKEQAPLTKVYFDVINLYDKNAEIADYTLFPKKKVKKIIIAINPYSGWAAKEWPMKNFIELNKYLNTKYDVVFMLDKQRIDENIIKMMETNKCAFVISSSLTELIDQLSDITFYIGNDSGPTHIASYLGIATFTIYGPTNPSFHQPAGNYHSYIQKIISCSAQKEEKMCKKYGGRFGCNYFECIDRLSIDEVIINVEKALKMINNLN